MFVSLRIAMCQTLTRKKKKKREKTIGSNQTEGLMHTVGESEHFCTDMLRKFICSFESFTPNLGMFAQIHFEF